MPVNPQRKFDLPDIEVGNVLRAARLRTGSDLQETAAIAGLDWRVLSRIELGERPCRVTEFVSLTKSYGVSPELLLKAVLGDEKALARLAKPAPRRSK